MTAQQAQIQLCRNQNIIASKGLGKVLLCAQTRLQPTQQCTAAQAYRKL
jgi:hypothetical protein